MNRYAVLDNETGASGKVTNIAVAETPMNDGWIPNPPAQVQIGWLYDGSQYTAPLIFYISNPQITANGQPLQLFAGNYYCQPGDVVQLQGNITDSNGNTVTSINVPVTVKLPMVKHVNGQPFADEIYLDVTLVNGVITATGKIQSSGDWKILINRCNEAIARIGAPWKLASADITFLA